MKTESYRIPENRKLTARESSLLEWLLENGTLEARTLLPQIIDVRVVSRCSCGCPTIDLEVAGFKTKSSDPSQIVADLVGQTPEGVQVGVILRAQDGRLSELEVYSFGNHERPFTLPEIGTLKPF